ncbi:MAG: hypothetical protein IJL06_06590 [Kiritimatiellae bacterium]|nr:hypothetical protein [Kiritimatiellia bacterium]
MTTPRSPNCTSSSENPSRPTDSPTSSSAPPETGVEAELAARDAAERAKREARRERIRRVREYLRALDDPALRKVAFLFCRGLPEDSVRRMAGLSFAELQEAKNRLRQGLVEAGAGPEA